MRISRSLAWTLLLLALFTAGLLRQFHDRTPRAPHVSPVVGSLLFAGIVVLLLVAAREQRLGARGGADRGIRIGSVIPFLLMLLVEKWASISLYPPLFYAVVPDASTEAELDAWFFIFAAVALLAVTALVARFSLPARRFAWRMARPARWPAAAVAALLVLTATYAVLVALTVALGGSLRLSWSPSRLLLLVLAGQTLLAFSEEVYYRGLLLGELLRLSPRLGLRSATSRRWAALFATSVLFGMEHFRLGADWNQAARQLAFTVSLGLLFGMLTLLTGNLHFVASIHAFVNWLVLNGAPRLVDGAGRSALPAGTYIGLALILAFVLIFVLARRSAGGPTTGVLSSG